MKKFLLAIMLLFATNVATMLADDPVILLKPAMKDVNFNAHITI